MRFLAILLTIMIALPASAQTCFVDAERTENDNFDGMMRAVMMAHSPIEYRNSCGLRDESDQQFFNAIRSQLRCEVSEDYNTFFGQYLSDQEEFLFAVNRIDLMNDNAYDTYCQIVDRIDLSAALNADGTVNSAALQLQGPLFQALQDHVAKWRIK